METEIKKVTPELRIAHLNLLANGAEVIAHKKRYQNAVTIGMISIVVIAGLAAYYECRIRKMDLAYRAVLEAERLKWRVIIQNEEVIQKEGF